MGRRLLASAAAVAASLLVLALPASSRAQTTSAPSTAHSTPAYLRTLTARGDKECIQPPSHFDLKTLSDAQLALYGLPTRQVLERDFRYWSPMLAHYKHRACGPDIPMPLRYPLKPARSHTGRSGTDTSEERWAGNVATGGRGTYQAAEVTFNVPYVSGNIGSLASFWAGVGGDDNYDGGNPGLVQAGVDVMICPDGWSGSECYNATSVPTSGASWRYNYAWYEICQNDNCTGCPQDINYCHKTIMTGNMSIYPNDSMSAYVSSNYPGEPYDYFAVCNNTRSTCDVAPDNYNANSFSDSATGECIGEEPRVTNSGGSDYWEANYGTEYLSSCYITNNSQVAQGISSWPHTYYVGTNAEGYTLQSVGSIVNGTDYDLFYCANQDTTNDFCG